MTLNRTLALGLVSMILAACANTPLDESKSAPVVDRSASSAPATTPPASDPRAVARVDATPSRAIDPLNDPNSPLAKKSVFFDFDSFVVKSDYQTLVEAHGRYLVSNKQRRIVIEGNADERGSREYNLALGQKRAEAVKSRLQLIGVGDAQVETVSFGEERARGKDEGTWAQDRRADLVYK
jgi:peptidoglycan-associated lipoprotein